MDGTNSNIDQNDGERLGNYDAEDFQRVGVQLSADRDLPLLLAVRNSTFVSHDQLFRLLAGYR